MKEDALDAVLPFVHQSIGRVFLFLPEETKREVCELRLRRNLPVCLTLPQGIRYLFKDGTIDDRPREGVLICTAEQLEETFFLLCKRSVYAHAEELREGYLSLPNGCRAGVCGRVAPDGMVRDITSLNLRIARAVEGCADSVVSAEDGGGILIAGPPSSGKTTVLRDTVRQLSKNKRVVVIDSRGEISGGTERPLSLGVNTDVLLIRNKAKGTEMALRTMFPQTIALDETGTAEELKGVEESFHAGVQIVTTAHIGEKRELLERKITRHLLASGAISTVALLSGKIGEPPEIFSPEEL
ncbi:MAG: hypothetical protein IKI29_06180 [Clostridia bacterium]|nr:hypothetical protein [Clostridia bacterium]